MKLLALTYELEVEARGGSDHLRKEPQKIMTEGNIRQPTQEQGNTETEAPSIPEQVCCVFVWKELWNLDMFRYMECMGYSGFRALLYLLN